MPYQQMPTFKAVPDKIMQMPQPGIGGLNLKDLEFEQEVNQSPYMLNVMYRNGAFGKRYGQELYKKVGNTIGISSATIYASVYYDDAIFVHAGNRLWKESGNSFVSVSGSKTFAETEGQFIVYAQKLYYLITDGFFQYDSTQNKFINVVPYVPQTLINCRPDGTKSEKIDEYNVLGTQFTHVYNAENGVTVYKIYNSEDIKNVKPTILVNDEPVTDFQWSLANGTITFTTAPPEGEMNVEVTYTIKDGAFATEKNQILSCKYHDTFGGANNSRLFLAGCGYSKYYYSHAYDISYFPENSWATVGNTEDDITGFGKQYNVLIVFKPKEVYSIYSFTETASTTLDTQRIGLEGFKSQLVNARTGCDAPHTIELINNQLTWFNSNEGVCTLVSTNIVDERNVRVLSRNIERTNNFGVKGILDYDFSANGESLETIQSVDYENKYFLVFPKSGIAFMWDYEISPYRFSAQGETPPKQLDWFMFDKFYVKHFLKIGKDLIYACSHTNYCNCYIKLNTGFSDVNYENDKDKQGNVLEKISIKAYYMTPFLQFGAVESLKNVKNIYVQCRGDTASVIDMYYYTEESLSPEEESDSIRIGGRLWSKFHWSTFQWLSVNYARTFRRKCNLKKVQMASFYFQNEEVDRDMSITHLSLQYQIVKYIR